MMPGDLWCQDLELDGWDAGKKPIPYLYYLALKKPSKALSKLSHTKVMNEFVT